MTGIVRHTHLTCGGVYICVSPHIMTSQSMIIFLQAMNNTYYYYHLPYIVKHSYSKYANKIKYLNLTIDIVNYVH